MNAVLVTTYIEKVNWVNEIRDKSLDITIYSTGDKNIVEWPNGHFITPNKGMDANMYLHYIITNYDNLPDRILFIHSHRTHWSHDYPLPFIANYINWELDDYFNIGSRTKYIDDIYFLHPAYYKWMKKVWSIYERYLPFPKKLSFYSGTQFMCHKDLILQYPLEYYKELHNFLLESTLSDEVIGRVLGEFIWHYLFTKNPIDKKYRSDQILKRT